MMKYKTTHILIFFKLFLLSLIFCLPKIPSSGVTEHILSNQHKSEVSTFFVAGHFNLEQKVIKKAHLLFDGLLFSKASSFHFIIISEHNPIPLFTFSKTCHFLFNSFARAPPLFS